MAWNDVGARDISTESTSDLIKLEGKKRLRLLLPETGPVSHWFYSISTPADDYRTWMSPAKEEDFFAKNRSIFRVRPTHAGLAFDYDENKIGILESGNQVWEGIKVLVDAGKDLNGRDIIITRKGTGRNTEYTVTDMDPAPMNINIENMEKPDMDARYTPPTYEEVIEDLRQMGFTSPEEIFESRPLGYEQAIVTKVPFGKHRDKTMQDVYNSDSQYLLFLATKIDRDDIKQSARVVCNQLMGTNYDVSGIPPAIDNVAFVAPDNSGSQQTPPPEQQQTPPAPPAQQQTPPPEQQQTPPQTGGADRDSIIAEVNSKFETDPKYKDFMLIINAMKEASAPNGKTSINDFTDDELARLKQIVIG